MKIKILVPKEIELPEGYKQVTRGKIRDDDMIYWVNTDQWMMANPALAGLWVAEAYCVARFNN